MPHAAERLRPSRLDSEHATHVGPDLAQAAGVDPLARRPDAASAVPDRPLAGGSSTHLNRGSEQPLDRPASRGCSTPANVYRVPSRRSSAVA
jgi:hypothetical protein